MVAQKGGQLAQQHRRGRRREKAGGAEGQHIAEIGAAGEISLGVSVNPWLSNTIDAAFTTD